MEWPLIFKDKIGVEKSIVHSDGRGIATVLRGVTFRSTSFDALETDQVSDSSLLDSFSFCLGGLCSCSFECYIDIPVWKNGDIICGQLKMVLELGDPKENGAIDKENLILTLFYDGETFASSGSSGFFEDELLEIQKKLPEETYMKACINCAYSDYSPFGNGLFGTMMCFRNIKREYLRVKSKDEFLEIQDRYDSTVQETYCCYEFALRVSGTGYRG